MDKFTCKHYLIATLLFSGSCLSSAEAVTDFGPVDMGAFYTSLSQAPADSKLGTVVKSEKIPTTMSGVDVWKIAYVSSDLHDKQTLVTGIIAVPQGDAPASGRPIVAWAHGTTGTAQTCGPSQVLNPAQPLNQYLMPAGNSWTDFGLPAMEAFIKAGYVIVATDYQGLGGGGKHQYAVARSQAHDVINSVRAASDFKEASAGNKAIVYGWSQGGGATITAAGLSDYLNRKGSAHDGIELLGFVAMAPYDLAATIPEGELTDELATKYLQGLSDEFGTNIFNFSHYVQNLWGMTAAFPQLKLDDILTDQGAKIGNEILLRKCMHVVSDTLSYNYANNYKQALRSPIKNAKAWVEAYREGSVKPVKPMAPVIIYFGTHDTTVPPIMGKLYRDQMCKMGANVTRIQLPGDQDHFTTPAISEPYYVKWVADRFAGIPVPNGCSDAAASNQST